MEPQRSLSAGEIAQRLGGDLRGDAGRRLARVAALDDAGADALSWAHSPRFLKRVGATSAGAVIVPRSHAEPAPAVLILVDDVEDALCAALEVFGPPPMRVAPGVHPTAIVAASAEIRDVRVGAGAFVGQRTRIGPDTEIHAGVFIGDDVLIGARCVIWPGVVIRERVRIGERVVIHPNSTIGADGFGYIFRQGRHRKVPHTGTVEIGDDVEIGANSAIDRAKCGVTRVGRGTKIDNCVQIGHNADVGEDCILVAQCGLSGSTTIEHHAILAGQVGVADHVRIGAGAQLAAQAGVPSDVPAGARYGGSPAFEMRTFLRSMMALERLPELQQTVRDLKKRIEQLESAAHHPD
ncbi:MAG: UDP-3-O-acylglucosamine N-acyltransferase [Phycisphaerae bacterium]|nr:UDP-3-O-acylglucosamine N-acyltransferase [Phycisphaerae bacterium]